MEITLRQLGQVRALARYRHFGQAAESLSISQPALTRSIQRLERSLGVALFDRDRQHGVAPTQYGELILARGESLLREADELLREIKLRRGLQIGELGIATGFFPNEFLVNRAVGRLIRNHPALRCQVDITTWREAARRVLDAEADIAVTDLSEARLDERLECELLDRYPFVFACRPGHPLLELDTITTAELSAYPWVATLGPSRVSAQMGDQLGRSGYRDAETGFFVPAIVVGDLSAAIQVATESDAVAAAPTGSLLPRVFQGLLRELPFQVPWMILELGFILRRRRTPSAATLTFIEELRGVAAELREQAE